MKFDKILIDKLKFRVGNGLGKTIKTVGKKEVKERYNVLGYYDARDVAAYLDDVVGCENRQDQYYEVKDNLFCRVGIKVDSEWVWKSDCGVESNVEKEKGESSDSFKRACVKWGIGRQLYDLPTLMIKYDELDKTHNKKKVKYNLTEYCRERFNKDLNEWYIKQTKPKKEEPLVKPTNEDLPY